MGLWNTLFAWFAFAAVWSVGESRAPLWLLAVLAHGIATTQSFLTQRNWVFRPTEGSAIAQFWRFQLVYAGLLGAGVFMLQALAAQGLHPLVAQTCVMATQAVIGFAMGRSFTFSERPVAVRHLFARAARAVRASIGVWLMFVFSTATFYLLMIEPFYQSPDHVGHDFSLSGIALLEGANWLYANGFFGGLFNPPWFTPAWCAGTAFFADPQAGFYSPIQWLAVLLDPFRAVAIGTLIFSGLAFWGSYFLGRMTLRWPRHPSAIFALLGMVNTFQPMRSAVGESGYQAFALWPWVMLAISWPTAVAARWHSRVGIPSLMVALGLTGWIQFGFAGMMVPTFLGITLLSLVLALTGQLSLALAAWRVTIGAVMAIAINASKLYEAASLMRNFPRDFYSLPGFPNLYDALVAGFMALFAPSEWTAFFAQRRMTNVQFTAFPHEWALEFGWGALLMAGVAYILFVRSRATKAMPAHASARASRGGSSSATSSVKMLVGACALALLCLPILLLWDQGTVRSVLKAIPILNSAAWPMRWLVIYIPLAQVLLALPVAKQLALSQPEVRRTALTVGAALLVWLGPMTMPTAYYRNGEIQSYDPRPIAAAHAALVRSGTPIAIDRVAEAPTDGLPLNRNDSMLQGASEGYCYNPIYGYRLEAFPQIERITAGPVLAQHADGQSFIFNPACLIHPAENRCKPGDGFRLSEPAQRHAAENFVARRPFSWSRPWVGDLASWVSQGALWVVLTTVIALVWTSILRSAEPT